MSAMTNSNRIIIKANRNLYQDQVIFLKVLSNKSNKSESEILRDIIDLYMKENKNVPKSSVGGK